MSNNFKKLVAILMADNIQFALKLSIGGTWFVIDNAFDYENHRWEVDDITGLLTFWTKQNDFSRAIYYKDLDDCVYAIKKTLGVN